MSLIVECVVCGEKWDMDYELPVCTCDTDVDWSLAEIEPGER